MYRIQYQDGHYDPELLVFESEEYGAALAMLKKLAGDWVIGAFGTVEPVRCNSIGLNHYGFRVTTPDSRAFNKDRYVTYTIVEVDE